MRLPAMLAAMMGRLFRVLTGSYAPYVVPRVTSVAKSAEMEMIQKTEFSPVQIVKVDEDQRTVFGFFSVVEENGKAVLDKQDDIIEVDTLEKAAYDFVLNARIAGEVHSRMDVGHLVESVVFTTEKQQAMVSALKARGIDAIMDLKVSAWWGGFFISDDAVWTAIKEKKYAAFSIGGMATREEIDLEAE